MSQSILSGLRILALFGIFATSTFGVAHTQDNKIGKIFVKSDSAVFAGQKVVDQNLELAVKDMKQRSRSFIDVDDEADAHFLIVVIKRDNLAIAGRNSEKSIEAVLFTRDGTSWKPGIKIEQHDMFWGLTAGKVMKAAEKWVKENKLNVKL